LDTLLNPTGSYYISESLLYLRLDSSDIMIEITMKSQVAPRRN